MEINPGTLSLAKKKKIWKLVSCSPRKMLLPFRSPLTHVLSPSRPSNFQVGPLSSIFLIHSLILLRLVSHNKLNHPPTTTTIIPPKFWSFLLPSRFPANPTLCITQLYTFSLLYTFSRLSDPLTTYYQCPTKNTHMHICRRAHFQWRAHRATHLTPLSVCLTLINKK